MTINTQVNRDNGTKSTNTMWGQEFKGNCSKKAKYSGRRTASQAQQEKTQAARRELVALTKHLKQVQQEQAERYCSEEKAAEVLAKSPNDLLREHYFGSTCASELKTFHQWKDAGYSLKKGETALQVWGKPFKANSEKAISTPDEEQTISVSYDCYPMVPLYSDLQVQPIDGHDSGTDAENAKLPELTTQPNDTLSLRLRKMAEKLQGDIDNAFADRLENTPKRIAQAVQARQNGYHLLRTQQALFALSAHHKLGSLPHCLSAIKTKKAVHDLLALRKKAIPNGYHCYHVETDQRAHDSAEAVALWSLITDSTESNQANETQKQKINALQFAKIPGYFPTPSAVIDRMCELAEINADHIILEPSAGTGAIFTLLQERYPGIKCIGYELNKTIFDIVSDSHPHILNDDFLSIPPQQIANRVVMNPPFERMQDIDHIQHAYQFLKPGGKLVAVMSPSPFFRNDKKALRFREWLNGIKNRVQSLPEDSFKPSGTSVGTKLVLLEKH